MFLRLRINMSTISGSHLARVTKCWPHPKPRTPLPCRPNTATPVWPTFVDLQDDDEHEATPPWTNKHSHTEMAEEHQVFWENHMKWNPEHGRQSIGGDPPIPNLAQVAHLPSVGREGSSPHPIRVTLIAIRSPSPDRGVFFPVHSSAVNVPPDAHLPFATPSDEMVLGLWRDRHAFHMRTANAARGSMKMNNPKPALRPPIQHPGLFHLMACDLLTFNLERGEFQAFEDKVQK